MKCKFAIRGLSCASCVERITKLFTHELNASNLNIRLNNTQPEFDSTVDTNIKDLNLLLAKIGNYALDVSDNGLSPFSGSETSMKM